MAMRRLKIKIARISDRVLPRFLLSLPLSTDAEAERVAKEAVQRLKDSRRECKLKVIT